MAKRKILPTKLYVLGHEYTVEEMSEKLFKEREAYGDCDNEQKKNKDILRDRIFGYQRHTIA